MKTGSQMDKDQYMLYLGRLATGWGIIGFIAGIIISLFLSYSLPGLFFFGLLTAYIGLTGFWGTHKFHTWLRKYRWQLPGPLYKLLKILTALPGIILGILFYGAFQQFVLLLALDDGSGEPGFLQSFLILTPKIGPWYADKIDFSPYGRERKS